MTTDKKIAHCASAVAALRQLSDDELRQIVDEWPIGPFQLRVIERFGIRHPFSLAILVAAQRPDLVQAIHADRTPGRRMRQQTF